MEASVISERFRQFCVLPSLPWRLENHHFSGPVGRLALKTKALFWLFWLFKACLKYLWNILVHARRYNLPCIGLLREKSSFLLSFHISFTPRPVKNSLGFVLSLWNRSSCHQNQFFIFLEGLPSS